MPKEGFKYKLAPILMTRKEITSHFSILASAHLWSLFHLQDLRDSLLLQWFHSLMISQIRIQSKRRLSIAISARTLSAEVEGYSHLMDNDEGELSAPLPFTAQQ